LTAPMVSALLVVWLLALPVHSHPVSPTPELGGQCACVHGARLELCTGTLVSLPLPGARIHEFPKLPRSHPYHIPRPRPNNRGPPTEL